MGLGAGRSLRWCQFVSAGRCVFLRCVALKSPIESFITAMFALTCAALLLFCSPHGILLQFGFRIVVSLRTPCPPPSILRVRVRLYPGVIGRRMGRWDSSGRAAPPSRAHAMAQMAAAVEAATQAAHRAAFKSPVTTSNYTSVLHKHISDVEAPSWFRLIFVDS